MSNLVVFFLVGMAAGTVAAVLMTTRWRHEPGAAWEDDNMILVQPQIRARMGVIVAGSFPLVLAIGLVRTAGPVSWPLVGFTAILIIGVGALVRAFGKRRTVLTPKGIELQGLGGRRVDWSDIDKVDTYVMPKRALVVFSGKDVRVAVDSSLHGWEEFVEKAPAMAGEVRPALLRALARLEGSNYGVSSVIPVKRERTRRADER